MKRVYFFGLCLILFLTLAGCEDVFNGPRRDVTVSELNGLRDEALVRLTGTIQSGFGEMYQFSDRTGTIPVEIDYEVWMRSGINPASLSFPLQVEIEGEVDKEGGSVAYIDVSRVRIL